MSIHFSDINEVHQELRPELDQAINAVIQKGDFINGEAVQAFASNIANYLKIPHVIPCANGTDAIQIALMALDLEIGDEVILPAFTYIAAIEAVVLLGLKPVLVDIDPDTFNMDVSQVKKAITPRTRVIMPVHLFGQSAPMEDLLNLADQHGLFIIEDNAQSLGSTTKVKGKRHKTGTLGHFGTTSFFPTKPLSCMGDGGALFTNDPQLAVRATQIASHGQSKKYQHDLVGINSRLDTMQAAILNVKLSILDRNNKVRTELAKTYDALLSKADWIKTPTTATGNEHIYHQYAIRILNGSRDQCKARLAQAGIPTMIYYPIPVHHQRAYANLFEGQHFPVAEEMCKQVICLPIHTALTEADVIYIAAVLLQRPKD